MARRLNVRRAIIAAVLFGLLVPGTLVGLIGGQQLYADTLRARTDEALNQYGDVLALGLQEPLWAFNPPAARKLIEAVMRSPDVQRVVVQDTSLGVFVEEHRPERASGATYQTTRTILHDERPLGTVRIEISDVQVMRSLRAQLIALISVLAAQTLLAFALIAFVLERRLVRPLKRVGAEADRLASGELDTPIVPQSDDEIGALEGRLESTRRALGELLGTLGEKNLQLEVDLIERRRAEDAAQRSEAHMRLLVAQSPIAIIEIQLDGTVLAWNAAAEQIFGWRAQQVIGREITFLLPDNPSLGAAELLHAGSDADGIDGGGWRQELDAVRQDDTRITCQWHNNVVRDAQGLPQRIVAMVEDITERKAAELRIRESRRMLQNVLDTIPVRVFWKDTQSRYLGANTLFARDIGLPIPDLVGRTDSEIGAKNAAAHEENDRAVMSGGELRINTEAAVTLADGSTRWHRSSKVALRDAADQVVGVLGVYDDISDRKSAELALAQSEARLRALIDYAPLGVFEYELDASARLILITTNRAADRILGLDCARLRGQALEEAFPGQAGTSMPAALRHVARSGERYTNDDFRFMVGGQLMTFDVHAFQTGPNRVAVLFREVSDLRRAASALRGLASARDSDSDPGFYNTVLSLFAEAVGANHASIGLLLEHRWQTLARLGGEKGAPSDSQLEQLALRGEHLLIPDPAHPERLTEYEDLVPDRGAYLGIPLTGANGDTIGLLNASFDKPISNVDLARSLGDVFALRASTEWARQRTLTALRESQEKFSLAFNEAPVAMTLANMRDGQLLDVNRAFSDLFGYSHAEAVGHTSTELGLFVEPATRQRWVKEVAEHGYASGTDLELQDKSGRHLQTRVWARVLPDGNTNTILVNIIDVTEQRRIQREVEELNRTLEARVEQRTRDLKQTLERLQLTQNELVQAEKLAALAGLVAGVAHELNTPIGNSMMVASTLRDSTLGVHGSMQTGLRRSQLNEYLNEADSATDILMRNLHRAAELISSFKQVAVDQTSQQRRTFKLEELVSEIIVTLQPTFRTTPFQVETDVQPGLRLDSYPGPLGQVLTNLIANAIIHGLEGRDSGRIRIAGSEDGPSAVRLTIQDNGCGIPPEHMRKIFDPFFTTKRGRQGSGLGLHIVHNIVTGILGGQISVESEVGVGTTFRVTVPRIAPHIDEAARE
ncbi:PAS domain S-box protein [Niveibacterium sp.]|uniref:PAS domain S-box protein n=1 Tax=Niveibacterium sp. TaxID=2017444 RepID=UPI0035ADC5DF